MIQKNVELTSEKAHIWKKIPQFYLQKKIDAFADIYMAKRKDENLIASNGNQ